MRIRPATRAEVNTYNEGCIWHTPLGEFVDGIGMKTGRGNPSEGFLRA